jgi:hypothetical protein
MKLMLILKRLLFLVLVSFVLSLLLHSCGGCGTKNKQLITNNEQLNVNVPDFNQDSSYSYLQKQMDFGPRVPNTKAHDECADYFINKLKLYTANVFVQTTQVKAYDGTMLNIKNIIASFGKDTKDRIFICAHWDSRPFADKDPDPNNRKKPVPAANDGASGAAEMIELARQLHNSLPKIGVDLVFLDAEDWGDYNDENSWGLGSQYWAKNPHRQNYTAKFGILLDMVGARNAIFTMEASSMHYAPDIMRKVWNIAAHCGYSDFFVDKETGPITDDHIFINKFLNIPTIDIIHYDPALPTGFFEYWHTTKDDIRDIDKHTLKAVGQTLLEVIYREN